MNIALVVLCVLNVCYDIDKVLESCEEIFVRELRPIKNRTEAIAQRSSKETTGVETRSRKKKEES